MKDAIGEIDYAVSDATQTKITVVAMIFVLILLSVKALAAM